MVNHFSAARLAWSIHNHTINLHNICNFAISLTVNTVSPHLPQRKVIGDSKPWPVPALSFLQQAKVQEGWSCQQPGCRCSVRGNRESKATPEELSTSSIIADEKIPPAPTDPTAAGATTSMSLPELTMTARSILQDTMVAHGGTHTGTTSGKLTPSAYGQ